MNTVRSRIGTLAPLHVFLFLLHVFLLHILLALSAAVLPAAVPAPLGLWAPQEAVAAQTRGSGEGRAWPVGSRPAVLRGWEPPATAYGRGHRGVDLAAAVGAPVRAAASGRVSFAGQVAGRGVLSITLSGTGDPPLRTTYEPVSPLVAEGDEVTAGRRVATVTGGPSHCAPGCLHWGLLRGAVYLNPLSLLPRELLRRGPSRLLPVFGVPEPGPEPGRVFKAPPGRRDFEDTP
ncbi:M23 family metallopeptidase [Streptomyces sp. NPDC102274]|uniref:M23 family metallopeptidase n=1 Tax=Streptomyces sp. NPDC102274 TaxID=3366151 RepID=UPI00380A8AE5